MNLAKSVVAASLPLMLSACSMPWSSPAPNGEAVLRAERTRESASVEKAPKVAAASEFRKEGSRICAGEKCVDASFPHFSNGSVTRQLSCSSMGTDEFLATVPEGVSDGVIPEGVLPKCDRVSLVAIDETEKNLKHTERNGKWSRFEEVSKIPWGYAVFSKNSWCGGVKWSQKILSESGTEIMTLPKAGSVAAYPETIKAGEKEFKAQELSANEQPFYLWTFAKTLEFPKVLSVSDDVSAEFTKHVFESSFLAESYLFTFKEYPGLRVKYVTKTTPSERIVFLWKNDAFVKKYMLEPVSNVLVDEKMIHEILKAYDPKTNHRMLVPVGRGKEHAITMENYDAKLPIFQIDDDTVWNGYYLAYAWPGYEFEEFGDPCSVWLDDWKRELLKAPIR